MATTEIPRPLKLLVQKVMRGFYPIDHFIVVDILVRKQLMKEDDLADLLKFDKKQLRQVIASLKNDKLLKVKLRMETGSDMKATRQNYYFINYKAFVNVVKYKLDHMRKKIEMEERDSASRAMFICSACNKSFTDLEVDQLVDLTTGDFRCSFCNGEVKEDPNHLPKADSRLILAKFNSIMEPLYLLLKDIEDVRLPSELVEPELLDIKQESSNNVVNANNSFPGIWKESDRNSAVNREYENKILSSYHEHSSVKIETEDQELGAPEDIKNETIVKKEQPAWMTESTVLENHSIKQPSTVSIVSTNSVNNKSINSNSIESEIKDSKEILETLLMHEKQSESTHAAILSLGDNYIKTEVPDEENKEDERMSDDDEEDELENETIPTVTIGTRRVLLNEVTQEDYEKMTPEERENYTRLTAQLYSYMYCD